MPAQRFPGPCTMCKSVDPSGYYKKQMCHNCYRKKRRRDRGLILVSGAALKQYGGPCVVCGSVLSTNGRFIRKMCQTCYSRIVAYKGNIVPRTRYIGPCERCGMSDESIKYNRKMCPKCYKWYRNNVRSDNASRRALERSAVRTLTEEQWQRVLEHHDYRCAYCDRDIRNNFTMDHVIPLVRGGAHAIHNVVPACLSCNSGKSDRLFVGPLRILYR